MRVEMPQLGNQFAVKMSFWNGMPDNAREVAGWMLSRDHDASLSNVGIHLGLGGQGESAGRLILQVGNAKPVVGKSAVKRWTWHQVQLECTGGEIRVFMDDGKVSGKEPEIRMTVDKATTPLASQWFFGGRSDSKDNWEGRLDEIAVFNHGTVK